MKHAPIPPSSAHLSDLFVLLSGTLFSGDVLERPRMRHGAVPHVPFKETLTSIGRRQQRRFVRGGRDDS